MKLSRPALWLLGVSPVLALSAAGAVGEDGADALHTIGPADSIEKPTLTQPQFADFFLSPASPTTLSSHAEITQTLLRARNHEKLDLEHPVKHERIERPDRTERPEKRQRLESGKY